MSITVMVLVVSWVVMGANLSLIAALKAARLVRQHNQLDLDCWFWEEEFEIIGASEPMELEVAGSWDAQDLEDMNCFWLNVNTWPVHQQTGFLPIQAMDWECGIEAHDNWVSNGGWVVETDGSFNQTQDLEDMSGWSMDGPEQTKSGYRLDKQGRVRDARGRFVARSVWTKAKTIAA